MIATIGSFDGVHRGHQALLRYLLEQAEQLGLDVLVITFDRLPIQYFHPEIEVYALSSTAEKVQRLRSLGILHIEVLPFDQALASLTAREFLELLLERYPISHLIMGYDHSFGRDRLSSTAEYQVVAGQLGIEVMPVDLKVLSHGLPISSSRIRALLGEGAVAEANELLGHPYPLRGEVVHGMKIGRLLGFPTANISPEAELKLLPKDGVYAVRVWVEDLSYEGMLYIGTRPTLDDGRGRIIELNIFDLSMDLYTKQLELEFIAYTREDAKFESYEALQARIREDEREIRALFKHL